MPFYRDGDRLGCGYVPSGYSSLKKSGLLVQNYCMKCGYKCWLYLGRFRFIETEVKVEW